MQHSTADLLDVIDQLQIDYRGACNVITESVRRIAELDQQLALAAQHADVQALNRQNEWNKLQGRLHAALDLAAHRGHYLALALDENWQLRQRLAKLEARQAPTFDVLSISSEVLTVADYVKEM